VLCFPEGFIQLADSQVDMALSANIGNRRLGMHQELATATRGRVQLYIYIYTRVYIAELNRSYNLQLDKVQSKEEIFLLTHLPPVISAEIALMTEGMKREQ
jgi:hypothetical protein